MAAFERIKVYQTILETGLVPLFFSNNIETSKAIVTACAEGGAKVLEFTNRGEGALQVFATLVEYAKKNHPDLIMGVGSVLDAPTAALFMAYGANFIVAPNFNPDVAKLCNRRKTGYVPGAATPTEVSIIEEAGMEIVKVFPPSPEFIKAVLGPMPWSKLMPSGGVEVTSESVTKWIKAGASSVGVGSSLISKQVLSSGDTASVSEGVAHLISWISTARSGK